MSEWIDIFNEKMVTFCKELACLFPEDKLLRTYGMTVRSLNAVSRHRVCRSFMEALGPHEEKIRGEDDSLFADLGKSGSLFKTLNREELGRKLEGRDEERAEVWKSIQALYVCGLEVDTAAEDVATSSSALQVGNAADMLAGDELFSKLIPPGTLEALTANVQKEFSDGKGGVDQARLQAALQTSMGKLMAPPR